MKFVLSRLVVLLILVSNPQLLRAQTRPETAATLGLEEAIELALRDNRDIRSASLEIFKFEDRLAAARTRRLPEFKVNALGSQLLSSLDFKFDRGVFGNYPGLGPIPDKETVISTPRRPTAFFIGQINQPLSQLYRTNLNLKRLDAGREIATHQMRAKQNTLVSNIKRQYYAILQTQSALKTAEETIHLYQELDRVTGEYVAQQVALKSESLDIKTKLAKCEYEATEFRDQLATQKEQLNQLLGRDVRTEFNVSPAAAFSLYEADLPAARDKALLHRPELQEAKLRIRQAELDRRITKSEYMPDVSLNFSYASPQNVNFVPRQIASIGVALSWEPFDWGRKKREISEKARSIEQARQAAADAEANILIEVSNKFRKLQQAKQLLAIGKLSEDSAREELRVAANRYSLKASLLKDVLLAENTLSQANHQTQEALLAFWSARADFEKAIGGDR